MGWIKNLFRRRKTPPRDNHNGYGEGKDFIPNWGIIIPHEKRAPGATSYNGKYSEYIYGMIMAQGIGLPYKTRDNGGVYGAAKKLVSEGVNATLEPHYNAYNGKAKGFEILVLKNDSLSAHYARLFIDDFKLEFPNRVARGDNGIKWISKGDRGYYNLINAKSAGAKVVLLSELFFGDNESDFLRTDEQSHFWRSQLFDSDNNSEDDIQFTGAGSY